jgi:wyosine [tRNA(Phe)-imidazoG37] synthetase (radical SAM superfamily)
VQLYVSVDAATKEKLKAIDRPLFSDFWERFTVSFGFTPIMKKLDACFLNGLF